MACSNELNLCRLPLWEWSGNANDQSPLRDGAESRAGIPNEALPLMLCGLEVTNMYGHGSDNRMVPQPPIGVVPTVLHVRVVALVGIAPEFQYGFRTRRPKAVDIGGGPVLARAGD